MATWTQQVLPAYTTWLSVTYGNGVFVAVAANSAVAATSPDGVTWTQRTLPVSANWQSVTYGNGVFVAVASNSTIATTSSDGITWTQRTLPVSAAWSSVTYGNGVFVAIAYVSSIAATSPNGVTWTQRTLPSSSPWMSVTYGNGLFVAVAYSSASAATSPNGVTWTQRALPVSTLWYSVTYGNGVFVAIAYGASIAASSSNGINWTQRALPSSSTWISVTYGDGDFVAIANASNKVASSSDGVTWTQDTLPVSTTWRAVTYGNNTFVVLSHSTDIAATSLAIVPSNISIDLDTAIFVDDLIVANDIAIDDTAGMRITSLGLTIHGTWEPTEEHILDPDTVTFDDDLIVEDYIEPTPPHMEGLIIYDDTEAVVGSSSRVTVDAEGNTYGLVISDLGLTIHGTGQDTTPIFDEETGVFTEDDLVISEPGDLPGGIVFLSGINTVPAIGVGLFSADVGVTTSSGGYAAGSVSGGSSTRFGFVQPTWVVSTGQWRRGQEYELSAIKGRSLTFRLDGPDSSSFSVYGDSQDALLVTELEDDVWWQRNGELLHRGRIMTSADSVGEDADVTFGSESYEALLKRRLLNLSGPSVFSYVSFVSWKPTDIMKWLIQHAESQKGMRLGLTFGQWSDLGIPPVENQGIGSEAVKFEDGTQVYDAIKSLQSLVPDFDFFIDPLLRCNVMKPRGRDRDVILDYGGVLSQVSRSSSSDDFADVIHQTGDGALEAWYPSGIGTPALATHAFTAERSGSDMGVTKGSTEIISNAANFVISDPTKVITIAGVMYSISGVTNGTTAALERSYEGDTGTNKAFSIGIIVTNPIQGTGTFSELPQGSWADERSDTNLKSLSMVQASAKSAYEKSGLRRRYSYSVTMAPNMWRGPSHVWIGDYVLLVVKKGRLDIREKVRVASLGISIDEEGIETVTAQLDLARDHEMALRNWATFIKKAAKKKL